MPRNTALLTTTSIALGSLIPVALYQLGAIPHLPDPPGSIFDSDRITASATAHPFGIPDSLPGLASYSVTLALILAYPRSPRLRPLLAAKLAFDGAAAGFNTVRQVIVFRRLCSWCMLTAGATAVMLYAGRQILGSTGVHAVRALRTTLNEPDPEPVLDALSPRS